MLKSVCLAYSREWIRDAEAVEEVQIMEELPHQLRRDISFSVNRKVFKQLKLFHDFSTREQTLIAATMTPIRASKQASTPSSAPNRCCGRPFSRTKGSAVGSGLRF